MCAGLCVRVVGGVHVCMCACIVDPCECQDESYLGDAEFLFCVSEDSEQILAIHPVARRIGGGLTEPG